MTQVMSLVDWLKLFFMFFLIGLIFESQLSRGVPRHHRRCQSFIVPVDEVLCWKDFWI